MFETLQTDPQAKGKYFVIFKTLLNILYHKGCMEEKFTEMYTKIICELADITFYIGKQSRGKKEQTGVLQQFITSLLSEAQRQANTIAEKKEAISSIVRNYVIDELIMKEIEH